MQTALYGRKGGAWLLEYSALRPRLHRSSWARCCSSVTHPSVTLFTARSTFPAFNGWKMTILLEELQEAGCFSGGGFAVRELNLDRREHKESWFLKINPNGRIPALVDHTNNDYALFESGAIMQYLADVYGKGYLLPSEPQARYNVIQWLFFQCAGVGPIQGQAHAFLRYVPEHVPYAAERFTNETRRLYQVLDQRLAHSKFVAGSMYSIADIALYPWIAYHAWAGQDISDLPFLHSWCEVVGKRQAVQRGLSYNPKDISELLSSADEVRRTVASSTLDRASGIARDDDANKK
mmetsp:Transcript_33152/g.61277  ORF Transcript_33152/g.61277 Transcript_33152/m.61277 type:complete len:293 (+) Transcript_33152:67-945(+)